jgi:hypothetical protein
MRKTALVCVLILIAIPLSFAEEQKISDDDVMEAAGTMFTVFIYGAAGIEYGQVPEGVSYDKENKVFSYENIDLTDLSDVYSSANGTIAREGENSLRFDFELTGGPVESMSYLISPSKKNPHQMSRPSDMRVNGEKYEFSSGGSGGSGNSGDSAGNGS